MNDVIGDRLPSAFAVALSPTPIVAIVLVLGSPQARIAGPAFALGWIAGLLAVSVLVVLGAALSAANPKNLALTLAAAASMAEAGLDEADKAIAVAVFVALGSVTVAGAVLFYLGIMMVVLLLLGAKLLGDGLAVL